MQQRDQTDLLRLQQLDKSFFPLAPRSRPQQQNPPYPAALPPLAFLRDDAVSRGPSKDPPPIAARATTRKHHLHQLLFSQNASNPFELVVEAATGKRQLHPRQWQPVDLLLPSGCDHAAVAAMAAELAAHVAAHCHGAQADLPASPPRRDALRNPQASLITTTTASTTLHLGTAPFAAAAHPPAAPPWSPQAAGGSWPGGPRQEAAWAAPSHPPPLQPTITLALSQPTTPAGHLPLPPAPAPPLHPPPPHSAPAASPAVPPPSTQGGAAALPTPHTALTASLPAHLHSSVLLGGGDGAHGHPTAGGMQPAGYGPITSQAAAMAAGGGWVTASSVQPLRAAPGGLFSERHSLRRHVQLTATWLEGRVAGLLTKHAPSMAAAQMRHLLDSSRVGGGGGGSSRGEQQGGGGPGPGGGVMLTPQPGGAEQSRGVQASLGPGGEQQPGPQPQQQPLGSVWGGRGRGGQGEAWASQGASSLPPPPPQPASPLTAADRHGSPPGRDPGPAPDPLGEAAGSMRGGSGAGVGQGEGGKGQGARQGSGPQAQAEALQAVLAALAGGVEPPAAGLGGESRGSLAARFTAFINSSLMGHQGPGPGAAWTGSQAMWRDMLQVVSAATANTLQQVAGTCWDEGAFLAGLWNLHTGLLNAGLVAAKAAAAEAQQEAAELRTQVRRLEPLLEWEHQARQELDGLRTGYTSTKALLQLAVSERDALLRENDKIILYYKKELRRFRREQRRNAWRLAKKLQSVQQQLSLVQRDRERLVEAVSYTKGQAVSMVSMVQGVNDRFSRMSRASSLVAAASDVFGGPDIGAIESSLQSLVMTVNKVQEITQEAEEHHFLMEEKVTAAAAADAVADDLVDAVLAGGDPDAVLSATAAAAAAAQEALEVDGLVPGNDDDDNYIAEAEPGPEDPAAGVEPEVSPEEAVDEGAQEVEAADDVKAEEEGAAVEGEPSEGPPAAPLAPAPSTELSHSPSSRQSQAGSGASSPTLPPAEPGAGKPSKGGKGKHKKKGGTDPHQGAAGMEGAQAGAVGPWGSSGMDGAAGGRVGKVGVDKEVQTGTELLEGVVGGREGSSLEAAVLQSMDEAAKEAADSLGLDLTQGAAGRTRAKPARTARTPPGGSRKKGSLMSKLSNTPSPLPTDPPPTPPPLPPAPEPRPSSALALQLDNPGDGRLGEGAVLAGGLTPRSSSAMKALVAGVQEKLAALQATLSDREERLGVCQTRVEELEQQLQSKLQEQQATKKKLEATHSIYQALRKKLQALGVDPDAHQLVLPDSRPATAQLETISQVGNTPETNSTWAETTDTTRDGPQSEMSFSRGPKSSRPAATANIKAKPAMKSSKSRRRSSSPRRKAKHAPVPAAKPVLTPPPVATTPESPSPPAASNTGANLRRRSHSPPQRRALSPLASSRALEDEAALGSSTDLNLRPLRSPVSTAFVLGKERVVERKVELSGAERLAENLVRFEGAHARTQDWLNKLIDGIYKGKMASDELRARQQPPLKPLPLVDFVFQHLAGMYGTKDMVNQYTAQLVATLKTYYQADPRVSLFYRFLYEQLPLQTLSLFLDGLRKLSEPARLPCVDYPPDWAPKKGSPPCADVRKCLWVADRLLMKRHPKTAYSLAVSLSVKSEPVPEAELRQYFVAPGYYSADIVNMREYERSRAEFRRMQVVVFLEALCEEYERCEGILLDVLPAIFKKWDTDQDSFISQGDILPMFEHMVRQGVQCDDVAREAQQFWQLATAVENDGIMPGLAAAAMQSELPSSRNSTRPSGMVSIQAFMAAGKESGLIRAYVRLHKTPPAKLRLDNSDVEAARILLLLLIRRHWALHKEALLAAFPQAGPLEPQLRSQAELLEKEGDGARKALALHGLLKLMIGRKLDRLVGQLSADSLALKVEPDFEESLSRLTSAVKVLYGADVIVVDEILAPYDPAAQAPMTHVLRQRQIAQVFHLYNELKGRISEYASRFLSHHSGISYFVARWRAEKNRRQSSRKTASSTLVEPGPGSDDCGFSFH